MTVWAVQWRLGYGIGLVVGALLWALVAPDAPPVYLHDVDHCEVSCGR